MRSLLTILATGVWLSLSTASGVDLSNGIAAEVNGSIITHQELERYTAKAIELLRRTYGGQPQVFRSRFEVAIRDGLEQLIERKLIIHEFDTSGGVLPESVIDDRIKRIIRDTYGDRLSLNKSLQSRGLTMDQFREQTREDIIINFMRAQNVSSAVLVSPAKIEQYYTNNLAKYELGDQVKLRMIVLNNRSGDSPDELEDLGREIRTIIGRGAEFSDMAQVYSAGSQRQEGGDWGWVEASKLNMGLSEVAFSLKLAELSPLLALAREANDDYWIYSYDDQKGLVRGRKYTGKDEFIEEKAFTDQAEADYAGLSLPLPAEFYLMKIEAKRVARVRSLDEVRDEIESELTNTEKSRLQKKWVKKLKDKAFIRYY